jgi:hypothetical protein
MLCELFASPCFAMLNPLGYGQFQSPEPGAFEQEVKEPELTGIYQGFVATSDEPSSYTPEQVQEESLLREEFPEEPTEQQPIEEALEGYQQQTEESSQPLERIPLLQTPAQPSIPAQAPVPQVQEPVRQSATPAPKPSRAPSTPSASPTAQPTAPVSQPPVKPTAPGKAHESITKANSKLSSALRRLDAIKGYYKEIPQEDRRVIKTKAENLLKEYQNGITKFAHRIGQVKNELGDRADKEKLAPFNTFIDLVNKLSQGIKRL